MIGGLLSAVGGAAQGFGGAIGDIMQQRDREAQRQQQRDLSEASRAATAHNAQMNRDATAQYRSDTLEGQELQRTMTEAYQTRVTDNQRFRDETARRREDRLGRADPELGSEQAERASRALETYNRADARRPQFDPMEFASYQDYDAALATHDRAMNDVIRAQGFESIDQIHEFLPGGSYATPSTHGSSGYAELIAANQRTGMSPMERSRWATGGRVPGMGEEDELRSTIREEMRGRR